MNTFHWTLYCKLNSPTKQAGLAIPGQVRLMAPHEQGLGRCPLRIESYKTPHCSLSGVGRREKMAAEREGGSPMVLGEGPLVQPPLS